MKQPLSVIENPICHDHPLVFLKKQEEEVSCKVCKESINGEPSYTCLQCRHVCFHVECIQHGKEVNHPCHTSHLLKIVVSQSLLDDGAQKTCLLCNDKNQTMVYHCSICNFTACLDCTKNPPPLVVDLVRVHKHPLNLFTKKLSAICNYCGEKEMVRPYMCFECGFVIDGWCIDLPRVININRHDHRISFTHHLGPGYSNCGACRESMSQYSGGYRCSICRCPKYAVHSYCAKSFELWDGIELEGMPEIIEDIAPFKTVGEHLICHVSHEKHILKLQSSDFIRDNVRRCEACSHTIGYYPVYSCEKCCYILHQKCANLLLKKRLVFDSVPFTLKMDDMLKLLDCKFCEILSTGFKYVSVRGTEVDVHCGSLSEPLVHKSHSHPLHFQRVNGLTCDECIKDIHGYMFSCDVCEFNLCITCVSLSETVRSSSHEHPITLCYGEKNVNDKYWCDICEYELDSSRWFYTCDNCGVTLHIECIIGDFSRLKPGFTVDYFGYKFEVVLNNGNTRPGCGICLYRCHVPVILKDIEYDHYVCSRLCFLSVFNQV